MGIRVAGCAGMVCVALALPTFVPPSAADTVHLRNGSVVRGRVIEDGEREICVEVDNGGIRAQMTFARGDVESIQRETDPQVVFQRKMADAGTIGDPHRQGEAYLAVGQWAAKEGLADAACEAFERCSSICSSLQEVADVEVARARLLQRNYAACAERLRRILEQNPNHEQAKALARELERAVGKDLDADLIPILELYHKGDCRGALAKLEGLVRRYDRDALDRLSRQCQSRLGLSLAGIMIDCRFRQGCPNHDCKGGIVTCPRCESGAVKKFNREVIGPGGGEQRDKPLNAPLTYQLCGACRGVGYALCKTCLGTGVWFGAVTDYEREDMVRTLIAQVKRVTGQLTPAGEEVTETVVDGGRTTVVKKSRPDNRTLNEARVIPNLLLVRRYLAEAVRLAPVLASPAGTDLRGDLAYVDNVVSPILTRKVDLYMVSAVNAMTAALGTLADGAQNGRLDVSQLRRAMEEAARARQLMAIATDIDPSARGMLGDDVERRQQLIEQFIRTGSEIMQLAAGERAAQQLPRAAQRAMTTVAGIVDQLAGLSGDSPLDGLRNALVGKDGEVDAAGIQSGGVSVRRGGVGTGGRNRTSTGETGAEAKSETKTEARR